MVKILNLRAFLAKKSKRVKLYTLQEGEWFRLEGSLYQVTSQKQEENKTYANRNGSFMFTKTVFANTLDVVPVTLCCTVL